MSVQKSHKFPFEIKSVDRELNEEISKQFSDGLPDLVQVGDQKMLIPGKFRDVADSYYEFELRTSDVFILGFPRSGTTLTQEMAWLLLNDLNLNEATKKKSFIDRVPLLESRAVMTAEADSCPRGEELLDSYIASLETLSATKETRIIKSHLHISFLPPDLLTSGCKVIYVARNPKDVIVSMYHLQRNSHGSEFIGTFETYFNYFLSNLIFFTPYWTHLKEAWERRNEKNFRFLFYEQITQNLGRYIREVAEFLDKELDEVDLEKLENTLSFDEFKRYISQTDQQLNNKANEDDDFVRKGKIGDYKNYFTNEMNVRADEWIRENLQKTGIEFPFNF